MSNPTMIGRLDLVPGRDSLALSIRNVNLRPTAYLSRREALALSEYLARTAAEMSEPASQSAFGKKPAAGEEDIFA